MDNEAILRENYRVFKEKVNIIDLPIKSFHCDINYLETWIEEESKNGLDLSPIFQRKCAWTDQQRIRFVENSIRRINDESSLTIRFNSPSWNTEKTPRSNLGDELAIVDGLQRLSAYRSFLRGEFDVFGYNIKQLPKRVLLRDLHLVFNIYAFQTRKEVLQFYLDINEGITPHPKDELDRVHDLLALEQ